MAKTWVPNYPQINQSDWYTERGYPRSSHKGYPSGSQGTICSAYSVSSRVELVGENLWCTSFEWFWSVAVTEMPCSKGTTKAISPIWSVHRPALVDNLNQFTQRYGLWIRWNFLSRKRRHTKYAELSATLGWVPRRWVWLGLCCLHLPHERPYMGYQCCKTSRHLLTYLH